MCATEIGVSRIWSLQSVCHLKRELLVVLSSSGSDSQVSVQTGKTSHFPFCLREFVRVCEFNSKVRVSGKVWPVRLG